MTSISIKSYYDFDSHQIFLSFHMPLHHRILQLEVPNINYTISYCTTSVAPCFLLLPPLLSLSFSLSFSQLLNKDPKKRISIEDAFAHPFLQQANSELASPKAEASLEVVSWGVCLSASET